MDEEQLLQTMLLRDPGAGTAGRFEPLMREALRLQNETARRAVAKPDTAALERQGYDRSLAGQRNILAGMSLATATPEFAQIAGQTHRQGLAAQEPWEMGEGTFTPGSGYVGDPFKRQDRLTKALAAQSGAGRDFAQAYGGEDARLKADQRAREQLAEQRRHAGVMEGISGGQLKLARETAELGKVQKLTQADGTETLVRITPQGTAIPLSLPGAQAQTGAYPAVASPKASDDEKKTTFMLNSILASARHLDPAASKPGFLEAAGRFLPGESGIVAGNVLSSAERQGTRASQEGIVDNLLTLSTGLSYTPMQLAAKRMEYLPSYTDKPGHESIKRAKLVDMVIAARARAGRAWTQAHDQALQAAFPELAEGGAAPAPFAGGGGGGARSGAPAASPAARSQGYGWKS